MQVFLKRALSEEMRKLHAIDVILKKRPQLRMDLRGSAAGQALLQENCIRLNAEMLQREGLDFARETLAHELCHLAVWQYYGRKARPHGEQWQTLMQSLGYAANRCHRAPVVPVRQQRRFRYRCTCRTHELSTTRHNRAQRGVQYICRRCSNALVVCAEV